MARAVKEKSAPVVVAPEETTIAAKPAKAAAVVKFDRAPKPAQLPGGPKSIALPTGHKKVCDLTRADVLALEPTDYKSSSFFARNYTRLVITCHSDRDEIKCIIKTHDGNGFERKEEIRAELSTNDQAQWEQVYCAVAHEAYLKWCDQVWPSAGDRQ